LNIQISFPQKMTDEMLGGAPDTSTLMQGHNSFDFAQTHSTPPDPALLFAAAAQQQQAQQQQQQQQAILHHQPHTLHHHIQQQQQKSSLTSISALTAGGVKMESSNSAAAQAFFNAASSTPAHKSPAVQWIVALQTAGVPDDTAIALAARTFPVRSIHTSCVLNSLFFFFFFFFFFSLLFQTKTGLCSRQMSPLHVLNSLTADEVSELGLVGQPFLLVRSLSRVF
jgi:hypothetical protein